MLRKHLRRSSLLLLLWGLSLWSDAHILVYHRFDDPRHPTTNTSLRELRKEFSYLKEHHYRVVPLSTLVQALQTHRPIPDSWVVLTIDDGFKSFLKALPLFEEFGYPFTIFISTKPTQRGYPDFLSWQDLKKIAPFGQIALHSHAHPHLVDLSDEQIRADTQKGIELFKKNLGFLPTAYAYPYGEYDQRVKRIIESFGFEAIANQNIGAIGTTSDPKDLDRIAMVGRANLSQALRYRHLDAQWIKPTEYPKDGVLHEVKVRIPPLYHTAWLYVTDHGWKRLPVKKGLVHAKLHYPLRKRRVRVIIKVKHSKINAKILVRSRYGAK